MKRVLLLTMAVLTLSSTYVQAQSSGMLLGVYAFRNSQGLRVTGTIPGYAAEGRIFRDDVLRMMTTDGNVFYSAQSHSAFEYAKDRIGPYRPVALQLFRPGVGEVYLWVEFQPINNAPAAMATARSAMKSGKSLSTSQVRQMGKMKVKIYTEREKPGAARLFNKRKSSGKAPRNNTNKRQPTRKQDDRRKQQRQRSGGAASLFGR